MFSEDESNVLYSTPQYFMFCVLLKTYYISGYFGKLCMSFVAFNSESARKPQMQMATITRKLNKKSN